MCVWVFVFFNRWAYLTAWLKSVLIIIVDTFLVSLLLLFLHSFKKWLTSAFVLYIVFPEPCSPGHYDKCKPWSACTVTCGGGTRKRLCESCVWSLDKWYTEKCNEFCLNGGRYSGGCHCSSWRSGHCCEGIYRSCSNIKFICPILFTCKWIVAHLPAFSHVYTIHI